MIMNVVIYKPFVEVGTFDEFKTLKLSVDNTDSIYITYENNTQTYGTPDIKWGQFVFIVDKGIIYLKGRFFEEKDEFILSSDYAISSLERENLLLQSGDTFEEAFGKIEKAVIDNEITVSYALIDINDRIDTVSYVSYNVIPSYNRPVSSGAVYTAIENNVINLNNRIDTVSYVSYNVIPSYNRPVSSGAVYTEIENTISYVSSYVLDIIHDNEDVQALALNSMHTEITSLSSDFNDLLGDYAYEHNQFIEQWENKELVLAQALNDLSSRITSLENYAYEHNNRLNSLDDRITAIENSYGWTNL